MVNKKIVLTLPGYLVDALNASALSLDRSRASLIRTLLKEGMKISGPPVVVLPVVCKHCKSGKHEGCFNMPFGDGTYAAGPACNCQECPRGRGGRPAL